MTQAKHVSETPATQLLRKHAIAFSEHPYEYVEHGGATWSAQALGLPPMSVVKTLVMQDEAAKPLIILMHGDREVSLKNLARQIGCKKVQPCTPDVAERHSGYKVGGTSPFATKKALRVFVEQSVLELDRVYLNGGQRGYLIGIAPQVLLDVLSAKPVSCALVA
jgi:Cys-tRNA(Pro) deacylase